MSVECPECGTVIVGQIATDKATKVYEDKIKNAKRAALAMNCDYKAVHSGLWTNQVHQDDCRRCLLVKELS